VNWTVFFTIGGNPLFGVVNHTLFAIFLLATAPPFSVGSAPWQSGGRQSPNRSLADSRSPSARWPAAVDSVANQWTRSSGSGTMPKIARVPTSRRPRRAHRRRPR